MSGRVLVVSSGAAPDPGEPILNNHHAEAPCPPVPSCSCRPTRRRVTRPPPSCPPPATPSPRPPTRTRRSPRPSSTSWSSSTSRPDPKSAVEICREIRATPALAAVPVMCVSGSDDVEERIRFLEAGADDVVARPFDARELEARVEALLLRFQRSRDLAPIISPDGLTMHRARRTVAVFSPKGGVGTTTIATNIAVAAVANRPDRVVLVDLVAPVRGRRRRCSTSIPSRPSPTSCATSRRCASRTCCGRTPCATTAACTSSPRRPRPRPPRASPRRTSARSSGPSSRATT